MDGRSTWTDCDETGVYVVPNVLSPKDLVFRPDNMDETVPQPCTGKQYVNSGVDQAHVKLLLLSGKMSLYAFLSICRVIISRI